MYPKNTNGANGCSFFPPCRRAKATRNLSAKAMSINVLMVPKRKPRTAQSLTSPPPMPLP